jgi:hypothetical protein
MCVRIWTRGRRKRRIETTHTYRQACQMSRNKANTSAIMHFTLAKVDKIEKKVQELDSPFSPT